MFRKTSLHQNRSFLAYGLQKTRANHRLRNHIWSDISFSDLDSVSLKSWYHDSIIANALCAIESLKSDLDQPNPYAQA